MIFTGTVSVRYILFTGIVPVNNLFIKGKMGEQNRNEHLSVANFYFLGSDFVANSTDDTR